MSLRIRRGTDVQRAETPLDMGELVYTTDTRQLYVGNGIDDGGVPIIRLGTGLAWADAECTTIIATGAALQVSADATPSLGGNLTLSGYNITGTGNIDITGNIYASTYIRSPTYQGPLQTSDIVLRSSSASPVNIVTVTDGSTNVPFMTLKAARGTLTVPVNNNAGDLIGGFQIKGYGNNLFKFAAGVVAQWSASATLTNGVPGANLLLVAGNNNNGQTIASLNGITAVFNAPILSTSVYSVAGTALPSASAVGKGARAFVSDATSPIHGTPYVGSGSDNVPVYSDGTSWFVG
jgi:hypothetical protein